MHFVSSFENLVAHPKLKILEPSKEPIIPLEKIPCALIPALAFDEKNHRLGYGKGAYDQLLSNFHGLTIGIGYQEQLIPSLPVHEHDIPLSRVFLF